EWPTTWAPSGAIRAIRSSMYSAYLAKSVSEPALREIIAGAVDNARTEATGLLHAAREETDGGADGAGYRIEREALALLALGDGHAQRVMVGALDGEDAVAVLAEEFERRDLAVDGELATWRRVTS